uniref:Uncharacterized protein n=1 Tax=Pelusios castaneus TaxID=367368 RepID=A0A8C8S802_9SAUR
MYTENVREGYSSLRETRFFRWLYEFFRVPVFPPYGGFPVKFHTHIREPIPYDPNITAAELADKTKNAVQSLIHHHQKIPGSVLRALMERYDKQQKKV